MGSAVRDSQRVIQGDIGLYARLLADESDGPVRALQSLSEAFSGMGASATPPLGDIVYEPDPRLVARNCKLS
jgi:hypothetical protein